MQIFKKRSTGYIYKKDKVIVKKINITGLGYESLLEPSILVLDHPNICPIQKVLYEYDGIYLEMPQAVCDLKEYYKNCILDQNNFLNHFKQLVNGLYYLNTKNIIHGDIKPSNILVFEDGLKYADFGSSILSCNVNKNFCGRNFYTKQYRPPEVWEGLISEKSDVWALGCSLFELYYGKLPFIVKTNLIYELPRELEEKSFIAQILSKMLEYKVENRISITELYQLFNSETLTDFKKAFEYQINNKETEYIYHKIRGQIYNDQDINLEVLLDEEIKTIKYLQQYLS